MAFGKHGQGVVKGDSVAGMIVKGDQVGIPCSIIHVLEQGRVGCEPDNVLIFFSVHEIHGLCQG